MKIERVFRLDAGRHAGRRVARCCDAPPRAAAPPPIPRRQRPALSPEGQAAVEVHDRTAGRRARHAAVRRQAGFRGGQARIHRRPVVPQDHGGRGQRRLEHRQLRLPAAGQGLRQHQPVAAAAGHPEHGLRALRSRARQGLPGARFRPRQHDRHQGRYRLDPVRRPDGQGDGPRGARVREREARGTPGGGRRLLAFPRRPLRRRARRGGRGGRQERQGADHRASGIHGSGGGGKRVRGQCDEPPGVLPVRRADAAQPVRARRPGHRQGDRGRRYRPGGAHADHRERHRGSDASTASRWCSRTRPGRKRLRR